MTRRLIPDSDQARLRSVSGQALVDEVARVRARTEAPANWRLELGCGAFYDPTGMTPAEIAIADQRAADAVTDGPLGNSPEIQALLACVAECCSISDTDARVRFTRHLRRINRKAAGL